MLKDIIQLVLQITIVASLLWVAIRYYFHVEHPIMIKIVMVAAVAVAILRWILGSNIREQFIVDWGTTPNECLIPPEYDCQIDECSDPQTIVNAQVEATLYKSANITQKIESFLRVNLPDKSEKQADAPLQNV